MSGSWVPNAVTLARGASGVVVAGLLLQGFHHAAFFWFIGAVSTDLVDGWLARRLDAVSSAGEWLDPLSDKILAMTTWGGLLALGWAPLWLAGLLLFRDVAVLAAWIFTNGRQMWFRPTLVGRLKISFEGVTLPLLLLHDEWMGCHWMSAGIILGSVTLGLSAWSAVEYAFQWARGEARIGPAQAR